MEASSYFFLGLAAEREACIAFRKSRLMLASNFLVGTFFSSSRLSLVSTGHPLKLKMDSRFGLRFRAAIPLQKIQHIEHESMIGVTDCAKPQSAAVWHLWSKLVNFSTGIEMRLRHSGHSNWNASMSIGSITIFCSAVTLPPR
jgi:hypothetical protein